MSVYYVYVWFLKRPEESITSPEITDGCELTHGCWKLNSSPLEDQPGILTVKPSLQPLSLTSKCFYLSNHKPHHYQMSASNIYVKTQAYYITDDSTHP